MNAYDTVAPRFSENLRHARKRLGISQEELGLRAELHRTEVGILERGARLPRIDTLVKLAVVLGSPLECPLLDGICWRPPTSHSGGFDVTPSEPTPEDSSDA